MTIALISRAKLLPFLSNLSEDDDRYDAVLESFVITSSELISEYIGRNLDEVERIEYKPSQELFTTPRSDIAPQMLWMQGFPINQDAEIEVKYSMTREWDTEDSLVMGKDYWVDYEQGVIRVYSPVGEVAGLPFPAGTGYVYYDDPMGFRVKYTGGYPIKGKSAESPWPYLVTPAGLSTAAALQTAFYFTSFVRGSMGLTTAGGDASGSQKASPSKPDDRSSLISEVRTMLRAYTRKGPVVGRAK